MPIAIDETSDNEMAVELEDLSTQMMNRKKSLLKELNTQKRKNYECDVQKEKCGSN